MTKTPLITLATAVALVAIAFATNPSPERHREKIKAAIGERSPLAGALGLGALTAFTSTYHPLGVASYTTVNDRTVSVGAFGMVFVRQPSTEK
jgi:multisubunit Na+/H+ antiporter MnhB subunit